jgi:hypothetical protein
LNKYFVASLNQFRKFIKVYNQQKIIRLWQKERLLQCLEMALARL